MSSWNNIARRIRVPLGSIFAAVFLWLARPSPRSLLLGSGIATAGLLIRAFASGHVQKNEQLATTGPYAHTRNPLYLGSLIMAFGFALASRSWIIVAIALVMFLAIYVPVIRSEEEFLRTRFPEFEDYCRNVPRLFPKLKANQGSAGSFSAHLYWKHREYNAAIGAALITVALIVKMLWLR